MADLDAADVALLLAHDADRPGALLERLASEDWKPEPTFLSMTADEWLAEAARLDEIRARREAIKIIRNDEEGD
jgi:hypothetical protein